MYFRLTRYPSARFAIVALCGLLSHAADATGFYNLGMQWRGAINPHHLGAEKVFISGFTSGLGTAPVSGAGDGMMNTPYGVAVDSSGNVYVGDYGIDRVTKFDSSGTFLGWIGDIGTSPTGGALGCNGAAVGTATPGWCTGGNSATGAGDGMFDSASGIAFDSSGNFYVADIYNYRIVKYNSFGVFQGWIGKIATSPTGGTAGCNGAPVGNLTPGWCTGGASASGNGDGMMNLPSAVKVDSSGNLYVTDYSNHRINKYDSTGAFIGWVGKIATSPTGGALGCNGATVGTATPGWCKGGTATLGSGDGMLYSPNGVTVDSSGNVYAADQNHRISKYDSSGAFQGWIGKIATSPTGGAAGCNGASVGTFAPGWCKGGTTTSGTGDGMMYYPKHLDVDTSGNIYVADSSNFRVNKYSASGSPMGALQSGVKFFSWRQSTYSSGSGTGDGMLNAPRGPALDSAGNIYVADMSNHRINKYDSTGTPLGWIGKIATSPTGGAAGCNGATVGTVTPGWCTGGTSST
jgi:sugar lactone lactonase YvrE